MRDAAGFEGDKPSREAASLVRFAGLVLNLDACMLARESGEAIPLTRGEFAVLRIFVARPGRVMSRDALLDAFTNRRFEPFDRSVDVLVGKLRRKIETDPKQPCLIVTVPGEGYRFDGLTQTLSSEQTPFIAVPVSQNDGRRLAGDRESNPSLAEHPPAFGATGEAKLSVPKQRESPRLSLVVLPFANIGGDPEQEYFVDGVTDSLTTDLSRIRGAFVIARSTAFTFKGKPIDVRAVGRELNVRYALEGSVQRRGDRMRVNVQLVDAESGAHLWAERFDKPIADFFDMQDEIVARLANQLRAELFDAEARCAEKKPNPDSIDLVFQGRALMYRGISPDTIAKARTFFERALELDGDNVEAHIGVGIVDLVVAAGYLTDDPVSNAVAAEKSLVKALTLAPNHPVAHATMGYILSGTNRAQRGVEEFERALALDPNLARARAGIGLAHLYLGRPEETETHILEALRLSPRDWAISSWFLHAAGAKACLGEYEAAAVWLRKSIEADRNHLWAYFILAACLALLGRLDEARQELKAGLTANPKFTIRRFRAGAESDNAIFLAQRERIIEGMRMAGALEG